MSNEKSIARDTWSALCQQLGNCRTCHQETPALVDEKAFPLFGRFEGGASPLLFIAEAPNRDDTYDTVKGYLTIDYQTDPSGKFFHELFTKELGRPIEEAQLTNAALCLPAPQHGKYPLSAKQRKHCAPHIKQQILTLNPKVVVTLGAVALASVNLLETHRQRSIGEAVAKPVEWFGRYLFPLYHTGLLARNGPSGRKEAQQRQDWQTLRSFLGTL